MEASDLGRLSMLEAGGEATLHSRILGAGDAHVHFMELGTKRPGFFIPI